MTAELSGRLVCDGEGHTFIQPVDENGESVPMYTKSGKLVDELVEVRHDPDTGKFVRVGANDDSHNDAHHGQYVAISGTTPDLYDKDGEQIATAEPHHYEVQPDDPHFGGVLTDPDDEAVTVTSHTDAYKEVTK